MRRSFVAVIGLLVGALVGGAARADDGAEAIGTVLSLPARPGPHQVWVSDLVLQRTALFDADTGGMLGMLSAGAGIVAPVFSPDQREIYLPETYYARGTRGERSDVVTVYDARSLLPGDEITLPPKRANYASGVAANALSDDGRFLAIFNLTPGTSLSIVDMARRSVSAEIVTPGCSAVYAAGPRRFFMLCGDGAVLVVTLDEDGHERSATRTQPFFDVNADPVMEKAARAGDRWIFVSFLGLVHAVDVSGETFRFEAPWPLLPEAERTSDWRVGGAQPITVHAATGRLYTLMHEGGAGTHKQAGTEVWVYDLARRERLQRIPLASHLAALLRGPLGLRDDGFAGRLAIRALYALLPNPGADRILVTQDDAPLLLSTSTFPSTLVVHDGQTGAFLRDVSEIGVAGGLIVTP